MANSTGFKGSDLEVLPLLPPLVAFYVEHFQKSEFLLSCQSRFPPITHFPVIGVQIASRVSIKLCQDVENDEYIILCNFGGHITRSFGVIEVSLWPPSPPPHPLPGPGKPKKKKKGKKTARSGCMTTKVEEIVAFLSSLSLAQETHSPLQGKRKWSSNTRSRNSEPHVEGVEREEQKDHHPKKSQKCDFSQV